MLSHHFMEESDTQFSQSVHLQLRVTSIAFSSLTEAFQNPTSRGICSILSWDEPT